MHPGSYFVVEELEREKRKVIKDLEGGGFSLITPSPFSQGPPSVKLSGNNAPMKRPGLLALLLMTCMASFIRKLCCRFNSLLSVWLFLLSFFLAFSSQNREWHPGECGSMDSFFLVDGLPKTAMGLFFFLPVVFIHSFVCFCYYWNMSLSCHWFSFPHFSNQ